MAKARWMEWVSGVRVSLDSAARHSVTRRDVKWKWLMVAATPLPWCPLCGSIIPPKAHKYRGETAMKIHEQVCWGTDYDDDEDDGQLQLESGEDNGTVQQEA